MEAEARFRAMGTDVHVLVVGGRPALVEWARERINRLEALWSRFRSTSEVSLLNQMAGQAVRVSAPTIELVRRALDGARVTRGRFDPTVLGDVIRAGYDRSFELLDDRSKGARSELRSGWEGIVVDAAAGTVALPDGVGFDPGGIGKGLAADLVVEGLLSEGAAGACVNVGGDVRVEGESPAGGAWKIAVAHPFRHDATLDVGVASGAVATSMRTRRTWGHPSEARHHVIDPSTGLPARTGIASVTVLAGRGWQAEVVAKAAFVAGLSEGLVILAETGTEGLLVDDRGSVYPSAGLDRFLPTPDRGPRLRLVTGAA